MTKFLDANRRNFLQLTATTLALASLPTFAQSVTAGTKLKIGIIGSGNVGSALGTTWAKSGHTVMFSSLDLEKDKALAAKQAIAALSNGVGPSF